MKEDESIDGLIQRAAEGDESARESLLRCHVDRLKRMIAMRMDRRLQARFDPSDVVQEALVVANDRLPRYLRERPLAFYPWLRNIAWEQLLKHHERHLQTQKRSVQREIKQRPGLNDESVTELVNRLAANVSSPSAGMVRAEMNRRLREALAQLNARDREILEMLYMEELETADAAAILGVTRQVVWTRHMRAIKRMTRIFESDSQLGT